MQPQALQTCSPTFLGSMIQTPQFCIRFQRNDLRKVKCELAIQTRSYYLLDSINLLDYRSRLLSFTLTILPYLLRVTEKFGSISFAWFDRYNYKSPQNNNISPYLGPPISGATYMHYISSLHYYIPLCNLFGLATYHFDAN